ncbi:ATP-grasp domain-containing protein [Streptomyces sp. OUCMDZ-4982]|uniref:ATP-grasp domain-containing protein n=1 Tax=Streptomyces sp. OUCMDZ-4982 TaxID=2973090 RepID=UPI00215D5981|nr:ATP-grasp domain-containing protein [Streptomyces sp. OUCMDZ-4982]MCR8943339.1 ATP-grasp domain-containing protein [Streptomyces sp. OUCMDZ-4982]
MPSSRPGLLALAPHRSTTAALLADAARGRGMEVAVLPVGGVPERYAGRGDAHYYGGPRFAARVARPLAVALLEPDDGWLDGLPYAFTGRHIRRLPLSGARSLPGPLFAKPPTDKSFPAAVYGSGAELPDVAGDPLVQVGSVVTWAEEFRLFLLDGEIRTGSRYAVHGLLDPAPLAGHPRESAVRAFARRLVEACGTTLPGAVVLDVGRTVPPTGPGGWAVVEANMAWFSNVYAADPGRALDVVLRSAGPEGLLSDRDRAFRRAVPTGPGASRGVLPE